MNLLHRKKIITVSDPVKKELVQGLLARHKIEYKITYSFYVDKADADAAISLLRSGNL